MAERCGIFFQTNIFTYNRHAILLLWVLTMVLIFWSSYTRYKLDPKYHYLRQILGAGLCISRGMASILNVSCFLITLPVCHFLAAMVQLFGSKCSTTTLREWPNLTKQFHVVCGYTIVFAAAIHTSAHIVNAWNFSRYYNPEVQEINVANTKGEDPLLIILRTIPGVTGVLMMLVLCVLASSSTKSFRYNNYNLFWFSHHLFLVFLLLLLCHPMSGMLKEQTNIDSPQCQLEVFNSSYAMLSPKCVTQPRFSSQETHTWKWITTSLTIYVVDVLYRLFRRVEKVQILSAEIFDCDVILLKLMKSGFTAEPGQFVYLHCQNISSIEWHPFSITKCPTKDEPHFELFIRSKGDWSHCLRNRIYNHLKTQADANSDFRGNYKSETVNPDTKLRVDGPFGSPMENAKNFTISICIAGGIGITPFISLLHFLRLKPKTKIKRLHLIWVCREVELMEHFIKLFKNLYDQMWENNMPDMFDFHFYITRHHSTRELQNSLKDEFSFIRSRLTFGRPKWKHLFTQWKFDYGKSKVGVFCSGPKPLTQHIDKIMQTSMQSRDFSYYQESFS